MVKLVVFLIKKHTILLHIWKAINHRFILALSYFGYNFEEYVVHTVLDSWTVMLLVVKPTH